MLRRLLAAIVAIAVCVLVVGVWQTTRGGGLVASAGQLPRGGWVSDAGTGAVVAGAALRITTAGRPTTGPALASTVTKEDGSFELPTTGVRGVLEVAASGFAKGRGVW